jgi:hypothetical protein
MFYSIIEKASPLLPAHRSTTVIPAAFCDKLEVVQQPSKDAKSLIATATDIEVLSYQ